MNNKANHNTKLESNQYIKLRWANILNSDGFTTNTNAQT